MTILQALADPNLLGGLPTFRDLSTWRAWLVFLAAVYGLPFAQLEATGVTEAEALDLFRKHAGRTRYEPPAGGYREAAAVVGRQAGKDRIASALQVYEAMTAEPEPDGTDLYALSICQDARAALRTQLTYAKAPFRRIEMLKALVRTWRTNEVSLSTGVSLAAYPCRPASVRGLRARVVVCSELAFFRSSEGYPMDLEMLRAVRPTLATTGGRLIILSSPYGQSGALYELHRRHFGQDDSPVLVWQATAPEMNPTLSADYLQRMEQDDPEAYRSEVLGEFRAGVSTLLDPEALAACVESGVRERAPVPDVRYLAHADPASGSGKDAFALAIAHAEGERAVLDVCRAWRPPFNPSAAIAEASGLLRYFGLSDVEGDRYAPGFVLEGFRANGITYRHSERDRSAIYLDFVGGVNQGAIVVLDDAELLRELRGLERRRGPSGRDRVDHRQGAHDDRAVVAAGVLTRARIAEQPTFDAIVANKVREGWQSVRRGNESQAMAEIRQRKTAQRARELAAMRPSGEQFYP